MSNIIDNLRMLSYGMYAIGVMDGERPTGCIVNTVFQITNTPAMVAISMNKDNYTYEVIKRTGRFSVSILSEESPRAVITQLGFTSGRTEDKLKGLAVKMVDGLPTIDENCCGAFTCDVVSMTEAETHFVILASIREAVDVSSHEPMTYRYYHQVLKGGAPKNAPSYVAPENEAEPKAAEPVKEEAPVRYICTICGHIYEGDITKEPDDFVCPVCGVPKSMFVKME